MPNKDITQAPAGAPAQGIPSHIPSSELTTNEDSSDRDLAHEQARIQDAVGTLPRPAREPGEPVVIENTPTAAVGA